MITGFEKAGGRRWEEYMCVWSGIRADHSSLRLLAGEAALNCPVPNKAWSGAGWGWTVMAAGACVGGQEQVCGQAVLGRLCGILQRMLSPSKSSDEWKGLVLSTSSTGSSGPNSAKYA